MDMNKDMGRNCINRDDFILHSVPSCSLDFDFSFYILSILVVPHAFPGQDGLI